MPQASDENIYSPETNKQQVALARRQLDNEIVLFAQSIQRQQAAIANERRQVDAARLRAQEQEASNWREMTIIRTNQATVETEAAMIERNKRLFEEREAHIQSLENQRRRNRTTSLAYIEDSFAMLGPRGVVDNLTNSSQRMRKHAMDNISACISGNKNCPPTFARFTPHDIAQDVLPKLHQLVSSSKRPVDFVVEFVEGVVSAPPMAKALAHTGQCSRLADYLIEGNEFASRLAVCCLRRMVGMETSVVKPAYEAMALVIPHIPIPKSDEQRLHPSIDFVKEIAPKIIEDCFNNGLWSSVAPLVHHHVTSIRQIVLRKVVLLARQSDRNQLGIAEAHILGFLDSYYQSSSPPPDVIEFFAELLPLVAEKLCRRPVTIQWLLKRLSDPNAKINATVIDAFRMSMVNQDPTVFHAFVTEELLRKLDEPPTPQSTAIMKLICQVLSVLAIPYARAKAAEGIVRFLDHSDPAVSTVCLSACVKIVESTQDDRSHLADVVSKLNIAKESTLKLYDHAMPVFCKDWAASGDFNTIVQHIRHSEKRIRLPAQQVWGDIVCNSPTSRSKVVRDGLLDVIFELCSSQYDDAVTLGAKCCSPMAIEITKAGVDSTRKLVALLGHPNMHLRQAALQGIQFASESSDENCEVLLQAEAFKALFLLFDTYPKDILENANKILTRLAPFLNTSHKACAGLLQLLESSSQTVQHAARNALLTISNTNLNKREVLRATVLDRLTLPTEPLIEFAVKAIQNWIGPDLAHLNDFPKFFSLIEHSDRRIQIAALIFLKQKLSSADFQKSLEKANIISTLRSLSNSDNPEALNFVAVALRVLALSLARNGHAISIITLLAHKEPKVRDSAAEALETISSGDVQDRQCLLEEDIIERLVGHDERLEQTKTHLLASIVPMLALDYLQVDKMEVIFRLVDHSQQQIRTAAIKSVAIIAGGTIEQKACLRDALLPRLDQASPLLREVAANCLSRSLARDLVIDGDFIQIFRIFHSEDVRVREPIIAQLRAYIQESEETARKWLVDAKILPKILQAYTPAKDDLLDFMTSCLLPMLGPSFTQDDGGATLFLLLDHDEHRLRASAIQALKNAIDSRDGNIEKMAKASVVGTLHPWITSDDAIRNLWCRILPKAAQYLTNRAEIDILFESLNDDRGNVREAASQAISVLAKTSETTRSCILPALLHNLENPSPASIPSIAQAISLSGITFVSNGKESELLHLILSSKDVSISIAAVEATIQLLAKGSSFEHQQLVKTNPDVLTVTLTLHNRPSQRQHSLKLLCSIVTHLSYVLILDDELAEKMFSLFDDPNPVLSNALYQTWSSDTRVSDSDILPELLPLLFENGRLHNPSVTALLRELAPAMVPRLMSRRRLDILVMVLKVNDANVVRSFLHETCSVIENSNENEKGWFVAEPSFVSEIGKCLKGRDATMRRDSSSIIQLLSAGSASRSGRIMNEGIGTYLSWLAVNGEKGAQQSSFHALYSLFMAAPDHAERLVTDSLPALCDILEQEDLSIGVYTQALRLLDEIVQQSSHSGIIQSRIVRCMVRWLSPRYSVTDADCKKYIFGICRLLAEHSDAGRQALIDAGILPELSCLANSRMAIEVISACKILKALAHTGTFRKDIISAGFKVSMENITSLLRKSTLQTKEEKHIAQAAAREVLETLRLSKQHAIKSLLDTQAPQRLQSRTHPHPQTRLSNSRQDVSVDEEGVIHSEQPRRRSVLPFRRSASESLAMSAFDVPALGSETEEVRQSTTRHIRHSQSLSERAQPTAPQSPSVRLSTMQEDLDILDFPQYTTIIEEPVEPINSRRTGHLRQSFRDHIRHSWSSSERAQPTALRSPHARLSAAQDDLDISDFPQRTTIIEEPVEPTSGLQTGHLRQSFRDPPIIMSSSGGHQRPMDEYNLTNTSSVVPSTYSTAPPSYRPMASVSGSVRRPTGRDHAQNLLPATAEDLELDAAEPPRSYREMASMSGSVRRK